MGLAGRRCVLWGVQGVCIVVGEGAALPGSRMELGAVLQRGAAWSGAQLWTGQRRSWRRHSRAASGGQQLMLEQRAALGERGHPLWTRSCSGVAHSSSGSSGHSGSSLPRM